MALAQQMVPIPLAQGVSTKADPKQVPIGKLLTLENGFFQTPMEIRKRYGFTALGQSILGGGTIDSINGQFAFNDELLISSPSNATVTYGGRLYGYDVANTSWVSTGPFYGMRLTTSVISVSEETQLSISSTYDPSSGLTCYTWRQASDTHIYASVVDAATSKIIFSGSVATSGSSASLPTTVVLFNNNFVFIYADGALKYSRIATSSPTTIAGSGTIAASSDLGYDAVVLGSRLYVVYGNSGAPTITYFNTSFSLASPVAGNNSTSTIESMSICSDASNNLGVVSGNSNSSYANVFDSNLGIVLNTTDLAASGRHADMVGVCFTGGLFHAYGSDNDTLIKYARFSTSAVTKQMTPFIWSMGIAGKPFVYNGNVFIMGFTATAAQPTIFLYMHYSDCDDSYPACVVGKIGYSLYGEASALYIAPHITEISTGVYQFAYGQQNGILRTNVAGANPSPVGTCGLVIDFTNPASSAQIANGLHIAGGELWLYDGVNITEHGFHLYPTISGLTEAGGGFIAAGTYQYIAVFEWTDGAGQIHRSAPTVARSITVTGANNSVTVGLDTLTATNKRGITTTGTIKPTNKVKICVYRTAASGTIFYFAGSVDNDITAASVSFSDTVVDSTLITNIQLYTTSGQVDNSAAPACTAVATYKSRLIVIPSDNPYSWWFSQEVLPDSEATLSTPVELSDFLIQNIDQTGGPLTGVTAMDDKLILMKKNLPYYVVGNGPALNGSNNDYSPPQQVTSPVGVDRQSSLVLTPMGVMFQATNNGGIWLMDRSLQVAYIGADVEAYNSQDASSAVLYPQYNQVRFSMSGGVCLAYDYYVQQWTVLTNIAAAQACLFQGQYTYSRSTGLTLEESTSTFTDNGTFVQLKIGTSWLKLAGLQGFQRIYEAEILGDYESAHTLVAKVYYDFDPTAAQTTSITPTSTPPYQWRLLFRRQKCQAMKIELYDTQNSPAEGMRLSAISLWVGVKYGLNKVGASRTFD